MIVSKLSEVALQVGAPFARWLSVGRAALSLAPLALLVLSASPRDQSSFSDPFTALKPSISIDDDERQKLDARGIVVKILPASGRELAVFVAGSLKADPSEVADKVNDMPALKQGSLVPEIGRFSNPPTLEDLTTLSLDTVDLDAIKHCRPGACDLKLSRAEIAQLRRSEAASDGDRWAHDINQEFRDIVLNRVKAYCAEGLSGIPQYDSTDHQVSLPATFSTLLRNSSFIQSKAPGVGAFFSRYPALPSPEAESTSFLYWSKEEFAWKPIISVTHVTIVHPPQREALPELLVASREVFATRYTSGALVLTLLFRGTDPDAPHYLVYINRTWVDGLAAFWRPFVDHRVKSQAVKVFAAARARIEGPASGVPTR